MAIALNGTSQYIDIGSAKSAVNFTTGSFGGWFYPTNNTGIREIFNYRTTTAGEDLFEATDFNGTFGLNLRFKYNIYTVSTSSLSINTWNHVLMTWNTAGSVVAYINGSSVGSATISTTVTGTANTFYIGNDPGNDYAAGSFAEFGLWSVQLSATDVSSLYKAFTPSLVRTDKLIESWPIFGRMTTEPGLRGYASTLVGSPSQAAHPRIYR